MFYFVAGLPPLEVKSLKKKVNDKNGSVYTNSVIHTNSTNTDKTTDEDDNGNRASVADLCKKFDDKQLIVIKNGPSNLLSSYKPPKLKTSKVTASGENYLSASTKLTNGKKINSAIKKSSSGISTASVNGKKSDSLSSSKCLSNIDVLQSKLEVINKGNIVENGTDIDREDVGTNTVGEDTDTGTQKNNSRVNNFASYISTKDFEKVDDKVNGSNSTETSKNDMDNKENSYLGKILAQNVSSFHFSLLFLRVKGCNLQVHFLCCF